MTTLKFDDELNIELAGDVAEPTLVSLAIETVKEVSKRLSHNGAEDEREVDEREVADVLCSMVMREYPEKENERKAYHPKGKQYVTVTYDRETHECTTDVHGFPMSEFFEVMFHAMAQVYIQSTGTNESEYKTLKKIWDLYEISSLKQEIE